MVLWVHRAIKVKSVSFPVYYRPDTVKKSASNMGWLASNPSKRWCEVFFLAYSPFWIIWALGILVPFQIFEVGKSPGHRAQSIALTCA